MKGGLLWLGMTLLVGCGAPSDAPLGPDAVEGDNAPLACAPLAHETWNLDMTLVKHEGACESRSQKHSVQTEFECPPAGTCGEESVEESAEEDVECSGRVACTCVYPNVGYQDEMTITSKQPGEVRGNYVFDVTEHGKVVCHSEFTFVGRPALPSEMF